MKRLLAVAVLATMTLPAAGQTPAPPALAGLVQKAAADLPAGGVVLAEVSRTDAAYATAGRAAPADGIAPEKVIFEIGSISKVFTSLLLAQTVLEGKATLADPIAKHLPADLALDPRTAAITLAQLASHTSGLPRLPANLPVANTVDPYATYDAAALHAFLRSWHPDKAAPQPFAYSNLGAGLLGHLLERIHGKPYAVLVREKIAAPLGLTDTGITLDAAQQARFAVPHSGKLAVSP